MGFAIISPGRDVTKWKESLKRHLPSEEIQVFPDINSPEKVDAVLLWQHPRGILKQFPSLKLICSMGAGVDHILSDSEIDPGLPISRVVDKGLTNPMTNYVLMGILAYQRQLTRYQKNQKSKVWDMSNPELDIAVGVLGVGALGGDVIRKLQILEIPVLGYGNSPRENTPYPYFYGDQLQHFLDKVNVIVCMLPLTEKTTNFLNIDFFRKCRRGTYLINVARGSHLVEEDLLTAINEGIISGAMLDVFRKEPLPKDHPFWDTSEITITPHIASVTNPDAAVPQILENYNRIKTNKPLLNIIDRNLGY
jgi:glyoxylate/hydroxypyruvate reductase A